MTPTQKLQLRILELENQLKQYNEIHVICAECSGYETFETEEAAKEHIISELNDGYHDLDDFTIVRGVSLKATLNLS